MVDDDDGIMVCVITSLVGGITSLQVEIQTSGSSFEFSQYKTYKGIKVWK